MDDFELISPENKLYRINGELVYLVDGWAYEDGKQKEVKYGILQADLGKYRQRGQSTALGQFFSLVFNGLIIARHIFQGLRRPLFSDGNMDGDKTKYALTWKPAYDYIWQKEWDSPREVSAPVGQVFVVTVSKNIKHAKEFPQVYGWMERWNWARDDFLLKESPVNWAERYDVLLWTREGA